MSRPLKARVVYLVRKFHREHERFPTVRKVAGELKVRQTEREARLGHAAMMAKWATGGRLV